MDSLSGEKALDLTPLCHRCVAANGLCRGCARQIAKLAQPFWYQLVGTHYQTTDHEALLKAMSPEARRVYNRKRTKEARRAARVTQMNTARSRSLAVIRDAA